MSEYHLNPSLKQKRRDYSPAFFDIIGFQPAQKV
jgi:hypothetical protein